MVELVGGVGVILFDYDGVDYWCVEFGYDVYCWCYVGDFDFWYDEEVFVEYDGDVVFVCCGFGCVDQFWIVVQILGCEVVWIGSDWVWCDVCLVYVQFGGQVDCFDWVYVECGNEFEFQLIYCYFFNVWVLVFGLVVFLVLLV